MQGRRAPTTAWSAVTRKPRGYKWCRTEENDAGKAGEEYPPRHCHTIKGNFGNSNVDGNHKGQKPSEEIMTSRANRIKRAQYYGMVIPLAGASKVTLIGGGADALSNLGS